MQRELRELTITFRKLPEKENYYTKTTTLKADIQQVVNNGLNDLIENLSVRTTAV